MSYSLKNIVEWSEKAEGRPRNLVLFAVVILYLFLSLVLFFTSIWVAIPPITVNLYYSISAIFISVVGFYTTTYPKSKEGLAQDTDINSKKDQLDYFRDVFTKILENK